MKAIALCLVFPVLSGCHYTTGLLDPKGIVASDEKKLLIDTLALMLIVVIPVIIMSFAFAWHYRKRNKKAKYYDKIFNFDNSFIELDYINKLPILFSRDINDWDKIASFFLNN